MDGEAALGNRLARHSWTVASHRLDQVDCHPLHRCGDLRRCCDSRGAMKLPMTPREISPQEMQAFEPDPLQLLSVLVEGVELRCLQGLVGTAAGGPQFVPAAAHLHSYPESRSEGSGSLSHCGLLNWAETQS